MSFLVEFRARIFCLSNVQVFIILQEDLCVYVIQFDPSFFFTAHLYNSSIAHLLLILLLLTELQLTDFEKHLFSIR